MIFQNRADAGEQLGQKLKHLKGDKNLLVLGLPRGGVVTAAEIARFLNAPLEVIICRKIGAPGNEEFAIGAISENVGLFLNQDVITAYGISQNYIDATIARETKKIAAYQNTFRGGGKSPNIKNKTVVIADDGAATGYTLKAAIDSARKQNPEKIIIALPVAPLDTARELTPIADEIVILETPTRFQAVGQFYAEFTQVETEAVKALLLESQKQKPH